MDENSNTGNTGILKKIAKVFKVDSDRMNAHEAYLKTHYDRIDTDQERVRNFIIKIDKAIEGKCQNSQQFCAISIPKDLMMYKEQIVDSYTTLGYNVVDIETSDGINVVIISWSDKYYEIQND